jgi:hypothetical protein
MPISYFKFMLLKIAHIIFLDIIHRPVLPETPPCLYFNTQRFEDWILFPSSGTAETETESSLRKFVF